MLEGKANLLDDEGQSQGRRWTSCAGRPIPPKLPEGYRQER